MITKNLENYVLAKCDNCKKELEIPRYRFNRAKRHFCSEKCKWEHKSKNFKEYDMLRKRCNKCGCFVGESHKCYDYDFEEKKRKTSETMKMLIKEGKLHSQFKKGFVPWITGKENKWGHHSEIAKRKIGEKHKGKIVSAETIKKLIDSHIGKKQNKSKETREKLREIMIKRNKDPLYQEKCARNNRNIPNIPEKILIDIIKKNNLPFNYVGNNKIFFKSNNGEMFNPDFLSKNPKHIIEVFGDYWHNLPKTKERDKNRIETYSKYGYKTLVIWANNISNKWGTKVCKDDNIVKQINDFISNG